jgi:hypothetical protein
MRKKKVDLSQRVLYPLVFVSLVFKKTNKQMKCIILYLKTRKKNHNFLNIHNKWSYIEGDGE